MSSGKWPASFHASVVDSSAGLTNKLYAVVESIETPPWNKVGHPSQSRPQAAFLSEPRYSRSTTSSTKEALPMATSLLELTAPVTVMVIW